MLERYYDELLAIAPALDRNRIINELVAVEVDAVAHQFYLELAQEDWHWRHDFPQVTPPWPVCWLEFRTPRGSYSDKHGYVNWRDSPIRAVGLLSFCGELDLAKHDLECIYQSPMLLVTDMTKVADDPEEIVAWRRRWADHYRSSGVIPRWLWKGIVFWDLHGEMKGVMEALVLIDHDGQFLPELMVINIALGGQHLLVRPKSERAEIKDVCLSSMLPFAFALTLMHCRNVSIIEKELPRSLQRKRRRQGAPTISFKTLIIKPMGKRDKADGSAAIYQNRGIIPLHIQRGHFKDYREGGGLFGKLKGIYWWNMHVRGSLEAGKVHKDYKVIPGD